MIAFTRYLYVKQDVETALILSLLDKDKERSLFWAYELFHSGFYHETIRLLWNIYYGFYALHAPSLESYFKKRISHDPTNEELEKYVGMMVTNLLVSAFDTQVFRLSGLVHHNDEILTSSYDELEKHLHDRNYLLIARSLFHLCHIQRRSQV